ncbi:MAG: galactose-1-phosphate uridylyltransferase [Minisyncoccia bacterium]
MKNYYEKKEFVPELRFDHLGRDWVIIAKKRAFRPKEFKRKERVFIPPKKTCPFCNIEKDTKIFLGYLNNKKILINKNQTLKDIKDWTTIVIENKYPAVESNLIFKKEKVGPYLRIPAYGIHNIVVLKEHKKQLFNFSLSDFKELISVFKERYYQISKEKNIKYIAIFYNQGKSAGASIFHPHAQIIGIPLIDPDLNMALISSKKFYQKSKKCIYCFSNKWEEKEGLRVVYKNKYFIAICPFASKSAFQVIISPRFHSAFFEKITNDQIKYLAEIFQIIIKSYDKVLDRPDLNFYLHTAPLDHKNYKKYQYYHWHFTFLPKVSLIAGFELGAKIEIITIAPEEAAKLLKEAIL